MLYSHKVAAFYYALLFKNAVSFSSRSSLGIHAGTGKYNRRFSSSTHQLSLKLSPEEIAASLGPDRTIATKPFTWEELKDIVENGDPTMHSRSMKVQESYVLHGRQVKDEWNSMNDYILHSKFGFERCVGMNGKFISNPSLEQAKQQKRVEKRLLLNEYPYYVCPGIEHWCLWKLGGKVEPEEVDWAKNVLIAMSNEEISESGIMSWVNPPHLQSIPDIDHAHLLCLRKDQGEMI